MKTRLVPRSKHSPRLSIRSVNAVHGDNLHVFRDEYKTHKETVCGA